MASRAMLLSAGVALCSVGVAVAMRDSMVLEDDAHSGAAHAINGSIGSEDGNGCKKPICHNAKDSPHRTPEWTIVVGPGKGKWVTGKFSDCRIHRDDNGMKFVWNSTLSDAGFARPSYARVFCRERCSIVGLDGQPISESDGVAGQFENVVVWRTDDPDDDALPLCKPDSAAHKTIGDSEYAKK